PISDGLALQAIRLIHQYLPLAVDDGSDKVARGQMLLAGNIAGQAFNAAGVGLVHAMAHVIGARHGVHHGTANAICLPHVIKFNSDEIGARYRKIAEAMSVDTRNLSDEEAGHAAANAVTDLLKKVGLPLRLRDVKVP